MHQRLRMIRLMKLKLDEAIRTNSLDSGFLYKPLAL
jgi:hypothetical protein